MSYQNYIPTMWAKTIERELPKNHVFVTDTNQQYEGEVANQGDTVRILGVGKPTVTTQTGGSVVFTDAETVEDTSVSMVINQIAKFNYQVGDIDKRLAVNGVMEALQAEATAEMADKQDIAVSALSLDKLAVRYTAAASPTTITASNVLATLDGCLQKLYENNVSPKMFISATVTPWFYMLLKQAYTALDTNNTAILENGMVGKYGNVLIRMSNNVSEDGSGNSLIQIKTNKALAFACPLIKTEAYRPEKGMSDAVKGIALFGAKVVRPKEMIVLNCKA